MTGTLRSQPGCALTCGAALAAAAWCGSAPLAVAADVFNTRSQVTAGPATPLLNDAADPSHAVYVIRLDLPDIEEYYE